ncbi:hypothetical protein BGZ79_000749 [Entomortierella chlamydospora]|nr:hypothetical protein BGZ79_000749 [Entomortierella chlamydospora]
MPAMVLIYLLASILLLSGVHAQDSTTPTNLNATVSLTPTSTGGSSGTATPTTATITTSASSISVSLSTSVSPSSSGTTPPAESTPVTYPPGTVNCFSMPYCSESEECFVLEDGLVCMDKVINSGYILSRNDSGVPSVPSWSGKRSGLNSNCTLFQMPKSADKPGLALMVYDLIQYTIPPDLLISRYDTSRTNWYTLFSNCETDLACVMGKCLPRPTLGQSCTTSWQCNARALGLNENNSPIPTANVTGVRCEYENGDKSINTTCQLLHRDVVDSSSGGFSAWHVIVPVVVILILAYFGTMFYQRRMKDQKARKWSRISDVDDRDDFQMEPYEDLR